MTDSKHKNFDLISSIGEEIINEEELNLLLKKLRKFIKF